MKDITIMAVHAHPDDEVVFTGGTLLLYHRRGVKTVLVTATGGEEGEIHDPDLDPEASRPRLRDIRLGELQRGIALLEIDHLELLGYRNSGMAGTDANADPTNFHNAGLDEVTRKLVMLVRRYKPQIMITYDEFGAYGHPDHIKCNVATHAAFDKAGDPSYAPELGQPWTPLSFYYTHWNDEGFEKARAIFAERGIRNGPSTEKRSALTPTLSTRARRKRWPSTSSKKKSTKEAPAEEKPPAYVPPPTTTRIDVRAVATEKMTSARQHRTQFDPNGLFNSIPDDIVPIIFGEEHYSLVQSRTPAPDQEDDMLAGLV